MDIINETGSWFRAVTCHCGHFKDSSITSDHVNFIDKTHGNFPTVRVKTYRAYSSRIKISNAESFFPSRSLKYFLRQVMPCFKFSV